MSDQDIKREEEKIKTETGQKENIPKALHFGISMLYILFIALAAPGALWFAETTNAICIFTIGTILAIIFSRYYINDKNLKAGFAILFTPAIVGLLLLALQML